VNEPIRLECG